MTNEESLKILNIHYGHQEDFDCNSEIVTALAFGILALEKQIPKKPIFSEDKKVINCPHCGYDIMGGIKIDAKYDPPYCWECGQRIDWSNDVIDKDGNPYTPTTRR